MPKPNYNFEKRQRELAKKRKQDEKNARKRQARTGTDAASTEDSISSAQPDRAEG
ncbi:hypothetical protein [Pseudomarimonas arenosa]|uniref:Uncharacterized protein n=1 Tax=Pseudomarimonas arenosa TaxID=2774145 RepID=A0AAW3ZK08_9GAMM|nr:hypothetical protein [Pseudomarimonas arenosa]MBD8524631.1 hypothetical protein [Pseudomarimonas arenosa]